jgi:hypothetical protein
MHWFRKPVIQARFEGVQLWPDTDYRMELWTLLQDIPGHPCGSTVSTQTIQEAGYAVPHHES